MLERIVKSIEGFEIYCIKDDSEKRDDFLSNWDDNAIILNPDLDVPFVQGVWYGFAMIEECIDRPIAIRNYRHVDALVVDNGFEGREGDAKGFTTENFADLLKVMEYRYQGSPVYSCISNPHAQHSFADFQRVYEAVKTKTITPIEEMKDYFCLYFFGQQMADSMVSVISGADDNISGDARAALSHLQANRSYPSNVYFSDGDVEYLKSKILDLDISTYKKEAFKKALDCLKKF